MVKRTEVNNLMQLIQAQQKKAPDVGDIFKGMINASLNAKNNEVPKRAAKDVSNPDSKSAQANKDTTRSESEAAAGASKDKAQETENGNTAADEKAQAETQQSNRTETSVLSAQIMGDQIGNLIQPEEIAVNPETKIYTIPEAQEAVEIIDLHSADLKRQLDNALLLRPQIKNQFLEGKEENVNTTELESTIKEMTGKSVEVAFVQIDKNATLQAATDKASNAEETDDMQSMMQNNAAVAQTVQIKQEAKPEIEIEKIFIKVSDNAELAPKLAQALSEKIVIAQTDAKNYEISLNPANLGKIFVKVTMENGITNLEMHFSSKKTMEMMAKDVSQLSQIIANNRNTEVVVQMSETPPNYLEQENSEQNHAKEQQHREQQRQSEDFINQLKETIKQEGLAM